MSSADVVLTLLLQIVVILAACRLVGRLVTYLGQTQAVGDMLAGIVLGPSLFGSLFPSMQARLFPEHHVVTIGATTATITHPSMQVLYALSQLGLVLYMFIVGLDLDLTIVRRQWRSVAVVSCVGIAAPFAIGALSAIPYAADRLFFAAGVARWQAALFTGVSVSITAFPMLARIIEEKGISGTRVGTMALAAGASNDLVAWGILAVLIASLRGTPATAALALGGGLVFVFGMLRIVRPALSTLARERPPHHGGTPAVLLPPILVAIACAWFTEFIGIHAVAGAFAAGAVMPRGQFASDLRARVEPLTTTMLLPLFFVYSGLNTQVLLLNSARLWTVTGVVIALATAGKAGACTLAARLSGQGWREAAAIGSLMNARGLVELIILNIAFDAGLITPTLFTILVLMALVTTMMTSPLFHLVYGRSLDARVSSRAPAAIAAD